MIRLLTICLWIYMARWREVYHCPVVYSPKSRLTHDWFCVVCSCGVTIPNCQTRPMHFAEIVTNCSKCFYSSMPQNCPRTYKLPSFDPDGDNVQCRYGNIRSVECSSCTSPSGFDLDQVSQQIHVQGMRKLVTDELIDA